ncbi:MAG: DNA-processing protein DprA [Clostridiales bacterium]|nr:DNA-processing protein DprA [Clostridiales bacterium]
MKIVKKGGENYPRRLEKLEGMPEKLYVAGELPKDDQPSLAIVGARNCSAYGKNMAFEYARILRGEGVQIISGMARGIDSAAHAGALAGGGKSYAVLGCGVDICYPASAKRLYEEMKLRGGVISEFEPESAPLAWHFPMRNRLISGLADAVLVIEAKEKSGSLITADQALEQGRTVFALPGRVGELLSVGCNRLIYQGAVPAWKPEIILEDMNWGRKKESFCRNQEEKKGLGLAREDDLVYSCLDLTPKTVTQLQEETGLPLTALMTGLMHLQLSGLAQEVWKNNYIRGKIMENDR